MLKKAFSLGLIILSFSCSSNLTNTTTTSNIEYIKHQVKNIQNIEKKDIKINISRKAFDTKQISGYSNAILPKKYNDIEYIKVFLIKEINYSNPFETGANIFGDGVYKIFNKNSDFSNLMINNVPVGDTYKAVVAAFDIENLNITKENLYLGSLDKKWYLSNNTVTVTNDSITYSSETNTLIVNLYLEEGEGAKINSSVTIKESEIDTEDIKSEGYYYD